MWRVLVPRPGNTSTTTLCTFRGIDFNRTGHRGCPWEGSPEDWPPDASGRLSGDATGTSKGVAQAGHVVTAEAETRHAWNLDI